jgi:haloacid dehalogenase superfamily, subfamily IA, variant 3 with third motif having DD or ED/haloacid dehalogenase superfamily, subfamily IA, variant 1 with third motif having Dx(3-4)D or Dx(3-4)E
MTETPRAVLFDLDETLYLERRFALSGFAAVARAVAPQAGVPAHAIFTRLSAALRRGDRAVAFQQLCSGLGWPESRVDSLVDLYRSHAPNLRLPRRTRQTLDVLRGEWRLGIVTNGPVGIQAAKVDTLGLEPLVDTVVFASSCGLGGGKPSPEAFVTAARRLGVILPRCVFVGDDPRCDIAGARRVGMKTIRIRRGVHRHAWLADYEEADAVTTSLLDVPQLAAGLLGETEALCA